MTRPRRKKLKVAVRRSRAAYQWRSFAGVLAAWGKGIVFVGSAAGLAAGATWAWDRSSYLRVADVRVEGPLLPGWTADPPVKKGQPLFSFSEGRIERRLLERYPQLESVRVRREWDRTVSLRLTARRPVARIAKGEAWEAVDAAGVLFPLAGDGESLPILVLPAADGRPGPALEFLFALRESKESWTDGLRKITMSADGEAVLLLSGETTVWWGEAAPDRSLVALKARRLQRVLSAPESVGGIPYARFVDDHRIVIKPRAAPPHGKETHG